MTPAMTIEIILPDGTEIRWALLETDELTIDRLIGEIEKIIGPPDTIAC